MSGTAPRKSGGFGFSSPGLGCSEAFQPFPRLRAPIARREWRAISEDHIKWKTINAPKHGSSQRIGKRSVDRGVRRGVADAGAGYEFAVSQHGSDRAIPDEP
jgi:hypothetical protein